MLTAYERHLLAVYLSNAASSLHHRNEEASALATWVADRENRIEFASKRRRNHRRRLELDADEGMSARRLHRHQKALQEERSTTKARCDRTARRLRCLAKSTGLNRTDVGILELLLRYQTQPIIESMVDDVFGRTGRNINPLNLKGRALSALLGISAGTVHRRFGNGAPLVRSGLVSIDNDGDLIVVSRLHRIATVPGDASLDVHRLLLPAAPPSELEWSDFDHIATGPRSRRAAAGRCARCRRTRREHPPPRTSGHRQDRVLQGPGRPTWGDAVQRTHDVRLGAAPADSSSQGEDLDASARTPRYRGEAGRGPRACPGVRSDPGRRGRCDRRGAARRRRRRGGSTRRAQPVAGAVLCEAP